MKEKIDLLNNYEFLDNMDIDSNIETPIFYY